MPRLLLTVASTLCVVALALLARAEVSAPVTAGSTSPLAFAPNAGQSDPRVLYQASGTGYGFYFTKRAAVLSFARDGRGHSLALGFVGANRDVALSADRALPGKVNYMRGNDPTRW